MKHCSLTTSKLLIALLASLLALPALAQTATTDSQSDDDEVESVVVAGSRIARESLDSSGSVQIYTAEDIADSGSLTVADFLRANSGNSFGSFNERSGSSAQSNAAVSLKGLGSSRTLVLVDGKRAVGSPAFGGSAANINLIPTAAVERIEIILDGAASVYGSDAIAGVVNIVLRKNYDGSTVHVEQRIPDREGGDSDSFSFVSGSKNENGYSSFGIESQSRDVVYDRDRVFTSPFWNDVDNDGLVDFYQSVQIDGERYTETDGWSIYGRTVRLQSANVAQRLCTTPGMSDVDENASTPDEFDGTCADTDPSTNALHMTDGEATRATASVGFVLQAAAGCEEGDFASEGNFLFGYYDASEDNNTMCGFPYAEISAHSASLDKQSIFFTNHRDINPDMSIKTSVFFIKNNSYGIYAPAAATWPSLPGSNALNPWSEAEIAQRVNTETWYEGTNEDNSTYYYQNVVDEDSVNNSNYLGYWRWTGLGPRENTVQDAVLDFSVDFKWAINDEFTMNAYTRKASYASSDRGDYYLDRAGLSQAVDAGLDLGDADVINTLKSTTHTDNRVDHDEFGVGFNYDSNIQFAGGNLKAFFGFERYDVTFISQYDGNSEFGQVGGSAGNSAGGSRSATGIYGEVSLPVLENVEISASFRNDDYSDVGGKTSFKLGGNFNVVDGVGFVASFSQGFRAPGLDVLAAATTFSAEDAFDYTRCFASHLEDADNTDLSNVTCSDQQVDTWYFANPNVKPEDSESLAFGATLDFDTVVGMGGRLSLGYYSDEISNIIQQASTQDVIWAEYFGGALLSSPGIAIARADSSYTGTTNPCGEGIQGITYDSSVDLTADRISYICGTYVNVGKLTTTGLSVNYDLDYDLGNLGVFSFGVDHSQVLTYEAEAYIDGPVQDQIGWPVTPETRTSIALGYEYDFANVIVQYSMIPEHALGTDIDDSTTGTLKPTPEQYDAWSLLDISASFNLDQYGKIKIDIANYGDEDPPLSGGVYSRDTYGLYNTLGRVTSIGYTYDF